MPSSSMDLLKNVSFYYCRLFPTLTNRKTAKSKFEIDEAFKQLIQGQQDAARKGVVPYGKGLLGVMLSAINENRERDMKNKKHEFCLQALVDECKTLLIGTETLALVFTWTLLLLAEYPEWQECA